MSDAVIVAIIGGVISLVTAGLTMLVNYRIAKIHKQINSQMDEFIELTKKASKAEGAKEEKDKTK